MARHAIINLVVMRVITLILTFYNFFFMNLCNHHLYLKFTSSLLQDFCTNLGETMKLVWHSQPFLA